LRRDRRQGTAAPIFRVDRLERGRVFPVHLSQRGSNLLQGLGPYMASVYGDRELRNEVMHPDRSQPGTPVFEFLEVFVVDPDGVIPAVQHRLGRLIMPAGEVHGGKAGLIYAFVDKHPGRQQVSRG
jgi:hypothetical protein